MPRGGATLGAVPAVGYKSSISGWGLVLGWGWRLSALSWRASTRVMRVRVSGVLRVLLLCPPGHPEPRV